MARKHEMISSLSSIPEGMLRGNELHITRDKLLERGEVVGVGVVEILHHPRYAEWHEVEVSFLEAGCSKSMAAVLHLMDESPFTSVYVFAWTIMHYW